ncbi:MAG: type II toxin-antitoxin system prevent-host-death family antitoxin [Anaerolinea sp.]|nr:type II toxin-antitoxin system prevent-host-death family antitoxin [Anaerolinea sp.]
MSRISVAEAKNRLSELIVRVEAGEEISVTRHGKPVARLVAAAAIDPEEQRTRVAEAFRRLELLCNQLQLEGDLKSIAREGLD